MRKLITICAVVGMILGISGTAQAAVYNIGDVGPAGGWIFYDLGNGNYLEAAPSDLPGTGGPKWGSIKAPQDVWGDVGSTIVGTSDAIGTGQANTTAIVGEPATTGMAKLADDLVVNGYDDWYLPSKDELDRMWDNLADEGIGGFETGTSGYYWSSSEIVSIWGDAKKAQCIELLQCW